MPADVISSLLHVTCPDNGSSRIPFIVNMNVQSTCGDSSAACDIVMNCGPTVSSHDGLFEDVSPGSVPWSSLVTQALTEEGVTTCELKGITNGGNNVELFYTYLCPDPPLDGPDTDALRYVSTFKSLRFTNMS